MACARLRVATMKDSFARRRGQRKSYEGPYGNPAPFQSSTLAAFYLRQTIRQTLVAARVVDDPMHIGACSTYLGGPAIAADLDLQEKCANRARIVLNELREDGTATYSRMNHYSEQLQRCFIWVGTYTSNKWEESLLDAFQGDYYGAYLLFFNRSKKSKQPSPPEMCYANLPDGDKYCKTYDEFIKLISVYLNMP
jgi:hypothetical protein